jgi:hypothetical protein
MSVKKFAIMLVMAMAVGLTGCNVESSTQEQQEKARAQINDMANKAVPTPPINNFLNREAVAEYMIRMDDPSKTFYVYLISHGEVMGYYITRTHPVSICQLMTPPEKEYGVRGRGANPLGAAPTLDGLYATGGDCSHYYALTADSDTLIEFSTDFTISDQPLQLEADKLHQE